MSIKEELIKNYMSGINFNSDNWDINTIKASLKNIIGETPAIDVEYEKDVYIDESNKMAREIFRLKKVIVIFTDELNNYKKLELLL